MATFKSVIGMAWNRVAIYLSIPFIYEMRSFPHIRTCMGIGMGVEKHVYVWVCRGMYGCIRLFTLLDHCLGFMYRGADDL
jgi:transposase